MASPDPPYEPGQFTYDEISDGKTTRLVCTCNLCGDVKVVTHFDSSLKRWEQNHKCKTDRAN